METECKQEIKRISSQREEKGEINCIRFEYECEWNIIYACVWKGIVNQISNGWVKLYP